MPSVCLKPSISCDFDGTITVFDTVDAVLAAFADPDWKDVESRWEAGIIGSRACLEEQVTLLKVTPEALDQFLDSIEIDQNVVGFLQDCQNWNLSLTIVSDGFDYIIKRVLNRIGFGHLPIRANHLSYVGEGAWSLTFPDFSKNCTSGLCKCRVVRAWELPVVHIGDGRSDACVSNHCDTVFAKGWLLNQRRAQNLPSIEFHDFGDLRQSFATLFLNEPALNEPEQPLHTQVLAQKEDQPCL